jgi:ATP-dependent DNA helicase PIF1
MGSFRLQRIELPIRLAFAMTINKAQGLTLRRVGVMREEDVFSHGQLYVAFSHGMEMMRTCGCLDQHGKMWIRNVVYKELLIRDRYQNQERTCVSIYVKESESHAWTT